MSLRHRLISNGFDVIAALGLHRIAAPLTRGVGAIVMFHHVRPTGPESFTPNKALEITPAFLEATILRLRQSGYRIVTMDEAIAVLRERSGGPPVAVLTFDDGYRDNVEWALPVLDRHQAPATVYVTTGFADRTARLWWLELEEAIRHLDRVEVDIGGDRVELPAVGTAEKRDAFAAVSRRLRRGPEEQLLSTIAELCGRAGVDGRALVERECLDWTAIEALSRHPLITIGSHTVTHPMLAKHAEAKVLGELLQAKQMLEKHTGRPVRHVAYPVGDPASAGPRDFALAAQAGYVSGVTTRPGLLYSGHAKHPMALPRVSIDGRYQSGACLDILLSGVAFAVWNRGRRIDVT
ncbi:polysaccharide deacetylase family protein [Lichenihabitans sp. PAMC28606]|uniref:polysaccharide deacetylase family protein n=1 Tax=Lichenihabitans sp. PAMC28606 TaxID=2880932 RepID=UPI001D0B5B90|nr:polysaccharide deacetylase family protein [Lichenihabitans sp. PAMC28606]UDL95417.1 polysaccharide deacetylase family protein [Lichenihabitans sp. PAMC28606]